MNVPVLSRNGPKLFWDCILDSPLGGYRGEEAAIGDWQLKRAGTERGIVEITGG